MNGFESVGLVGRAKNITVDPERTWPAIAAERTTPGDILVRYALPLIAIGPVANFLGSQLFGVSIFFELYQPSLVGSLIVAAVSLLIGIAGLIVLALFTDWLAPRFDGHAGRTPAFKLAAYSMTPGWIAGILGIIPSLGILASLAAIYSIYLFYKGASPVMKVPGGRTAGFTAVAVIGAIVLNWLMASLIAALVTGASSLFVNNRDAGQSVEVAFPGGSTLDSAKIEQAARQIEGFSAGTRPKAVDISALQSVFPTAAAGFTRVQVQSTGSEGIGALAQATYRKGDREMQLRIVDMAGLGAMAGALGGLGVEHNREDANGYERVRTVGGVIQTEKWDKRTSTGAFGMQVAERFMVQAEGDANSMQELKALVMAVDQSRLADLAR